jgi:hypothetical protein
MTLTGGVQLSAGKRKKKEKGKGEGSGLGRSGLSCWAGSAAVLGPGHGPNAAGIFFLYSVFFFCFQIFVLFENCKAYLNCTKSIL